MFVRLLSRFGTPDQVLKASEGALRDVVGPKLAERIRAYSGAVDIERQIALMEEYRADLLTMDDAAYPLLLAEIYDPPLVLFSRGILAAPDAPCVALVGTRKPTEYGLRMARQLAYDLALRGITVVSGMAEGIDTAAHEGALEAGGHTIAVLGCGVDIVYPPSNAELMHRIVGQGSVMSCFEMGVKPSKGHFPYRNRIISGLSMGTVVVEAPVGSGSLITARNAAEQGREVYAVPGMAGTYTSRGPHALLREGAKLVESAEDIVVELNVAPVHRQPAGSRMETTTSAPPPARPKVNLSATETVVLEVLHGEGSFVDEIAMAARVSVSEALSALTMLELKGVVQQFSGKRFALR